MNKLLVLFGLVLIHGFGSCSVLAQSMSVNTQEVFLGAGGTSVNYVKNPIAKDNGLYVTTSNATHARDTTDKLWGYASHSCDATALNGYCEFELKPITAPDDSGNCEFKGVWKGDGSLYRAQILDNSGVLKAQTQPLVNTTGGFAKFSVNAPCETSPKVRITQTEAGTAPAIKAGVYYGRATNIGKGTAPNEFSAYFSGSGVMSGGTNTEYFDGSTFTPTDTSLFPIKFKGLTVAPKCTAIILGGGTFESANYGWRIEGAVTNTGMNIRTGYSNAASSGAFNKTAYGFALFCQKGQADYQLDTITPDTRPQVWNGYLTATGWARTNVAYGDFSAGSGVTVTSLRQDNISVTAASGSLPGVTFTPNAVGDYFVCFSGTIFGTGSAGGAGIILFDQSGNVVMSGISATLATSTLTPATGCGILRATNLSPKTIKLNGSMSTGTLNVSANATNPLGFTIVQITQGMSTPFLTGNVIFGTDVKSEKAAGITTVDYGVSSVTATAGTNVSAVQSPVSCRYTRVGNVVTSNCMVQITCTTAAYSAFTIATPVAGTPSAMSGTMGSSTDEVGRITTSGSNALVEFVCKNTSAVSRAINFTYVLP